MIFAEKVRSALIEAMDEVDTEWYNEERPSGEIGNQAVYGGVQPHQTLETAGPAGHSCVNVYKVQTASGHGNKVIDAIDETSSEPTSGLETSYTPYAAWFLLYQGWMVILPFHEAPISLPEARIPPILRSHCALSWDVCVSMVVKEREVGKA